MDKRTFKTQLAIKSAFLTLAAEQGSGGIYKVHVNDLCRKAIINKSTFYRHYEDIPRLIETMRAELADDIFQSVTRRDTLFSAPDEFLEAIRCAAREKEREIMILFPAESLWSLLERLNYKLIEYYNDRSASLEVSAKISFMLGGASYVAIQHRHDDPKEINRIVAEMIHKLR